MPRRAKGSTNRFGTASPRAASRPGACRRWMADPAQAFPAPATRSTAAHRRRPRSRPPESRGPPRSCRSRRHRQRASKWNAEEQADATPGDLEDAEQLDVGRHCEARILMRISTRVSGAPGGITEKRKRSPPRTPAGTRSSTSWKERTSPQPPHWPHHSSHVSPRPPRSLQICRTGMPIGIVVPAKARGTQDDLADSSSRALAPKNACRMRSRRSDTDGKSIATSSANQSARPDPVRLDAGADRSASCERRRRASAGSRRRGRLRGTRPRGRPLRCRDSAGEPAADRHA